MTLLYESIKKEYEGEINASKILLRDFYVDAKDLIFYF